MNFKDLLKINNLATPVLALPRPLKRFIAVTADALLAFIALWLALSLRLESWV
ncbi:MAG: hypothetical protein HOL17_06635, partial [Gammaproteobacteria bacterium]|nr:hypothetical protein [Gammaproteobacteria bacterium]MBT5371382.1 hypothetical protein [Gammaproteobacteria bacterium]